MSTSPALTAERPSTSPPPRRRTSTAKRKQYRAAYLFLLPFFVVFITMLVIPLVYSGYLSLFESKLIGGEAFTGLGNYVRALTDPAFLSGLGRVELFFIIQVPIMLALALFFALALDSFRARGSKAIRLLIYMPYAVPAVVATLMWGYLYGPDFGPLAQISRAVGIGTPTSSPPRHARIDDEHRHVGVRRLQHDHHVRGPAVDPRRAVRGRRDRRSGTVPARMEREDPRDPSRDPADGDLLGHRLVPAVRRAEPVEQIAPDVITNSYTPNYYAYNLAFINQELNYAAAIAFLLGIVIAVVSYIVQLGAQRRERRERRLGMTSTETRAAVTVGDAAGSRTARHFAPERRRSTLLTVLLWLCVLYFVLPLWWLFVSSTKDNASLFSTFGLWFGGDFSLWENLQTLFTVRDGIFARWLVNTFVYSISAAAGATLLATMAGYAFAKYQFPGKTALFSATLGAIMIPLTALALPTYLLFSAAGLTDTPWAVIVPSLVSPFGVYLMRVYAADAIPMGSSRPLASTAPASSGSSGRWDCACSDRAWSPCSCSPWWRRGTTTSCRSSC